MVQHGWINNKPIKSEPPSMNLQKSRRSILTPVSDYLYLVSQTSSMHGLAHITAPKRHPMERLFWLLILIWSIVGAVSVTLSSLQLLQHRPTVMSMERDYTSWNTSFPAVTICPDVHVDQIALQVLTSQLTFRLENTSSSEIVFFLSTLADSTLTNLPSSPFTDVPGVKPEEFLNIILSLAPHWTYPMKGPDDEEGGEEESKGVKMDPIVTERGLCYTYNSALAPFLSPKAENETWTEEDTKRILSTPVARISPLDGRVLGQVMRVAFGFTVFLHGPFEIADASSAGIKVQAGHINTLGLSGQEVFTTDAAAQLSPERRRCRLPSESPPGATPPIYSFALCRRRCRAKLAKKLCGCVPHWDSFMREGRPCTVKGLRCLGNFQDALVRIIDPSTSKPVECDCLPSCDYVSYVVENKEVTPWFLGAGLEYGLSKYPRARLKRDIFFTAQDVLVSFGSAAGLFLGCSMLSLVEFFYFFTLGLFWYIRKGKGVKKDNENEEDEDESQSQLDHDEYNIVTGHVNHLEIQHEIRHNIHQRRPFDWRRHMLASGGSRTKLLAWTE